MNASKLIKLAPTLTMATAMAYAAYSITPPTPAHLQAATTKPALLGTGDDRANTNAMGKTADLKASAAAKTLRHRDPFVAILKPNKAGKAAALASQKPQIDPNIALVRGLTLNATFVHGVIRHASISGRLYAQGQHLDGPDDRPTALIITQITPAQVTLEADGNHYILAYPEQFTAAAGPRPNAAPGARPTTPAAARRGGRPGPPGRAAIPRR